MANCKNCDEKTWWVKTTKDGEEKFDMVQPSKKRLYFKTGEDNSGQYPTIVAKMVEVYEPHYDQCPNKPERKERNNDYNNEDVPF